MEATLRETVKFVGRVGKPANDIVYTHVKYYCNEYTIMKIKHNSGYVYGLIDKEDYGKIHEYTWHYISNAYIGHTTTDDGKRKELYLHNIVMDRLDHPGKGATETIDHINRNGLDNRKENLRLISQTEQNLNQKRKGRTAILPTGLKAEDIPKHIWYIKPNGHHGERFGIDFKTENIKWKTTSSTKISLEDKLKAAKEQLQEYYKVYPHLNPENTEHDMLMESLHHSFDEIIKLGT
jgi:hypothetical protein